MQVAPYVTFNRNALVILNHSFSILDRLLHFMRLASAQIPPPDHIDLTTASVSINQEQSVVASMKPKQQKQRHSDPNGTIQTSTIGLDESESHSRAPAPDTKTNCLAPEIALLQTALAAMGDLTSHCHGAFLPYDNVLRCFVLDPQLLLLPGLNRPSFTPKFIEDARLNMSKQLLPADMYPFSEPMLQRQLLYVPDSAQEASVQRALNDAHVGSIVSSQNTIISSMFQSLYGCGSLIACGFWSDELSSDTGAGTDSGYYGTFVLWAERQRTIPHHLCATLESICQRASKSIFQSQRHNQHTIQDSISSSVASGTVALVSTRMSFSKRLIHTVQVLLPSIFGCTNRNSMLDTTYAFAIWIPAPHASIHGFSEISELHLVASTVDGRLIQEQMNRQKLETYPVLLQVWARGGIVCIDGRGCYGSSDAFGTINRTREIFGIPQDRIMCETAFATAQQAGSDCVLAAVQIIGCQRAQGYSESELKALVQVAQMLGGFVLQEQENTLKQRIQQKTSQMLGSFSSMLSTTSHSLGKISFDVFNFSDFGALSLCEQNILASFPLRSVRSQLKSVLTQVKARSAAFILVDANESSVVLVLQVTAGAAYCDSDRQPKQCSLESRSGILYKCIKTRKPVVYSHEDKETLDAAVDHLARDKFTTCLVAPILLENRVVAVVQLFSKLKGDSDRLGKVSFNATDSVKVMDSNVLSAVHQRSRAHMHMRRSGRADLMALERLSVSEAHSSSEFNGACSPLWRSEASAPIFEREDIDIVVAASEACGQMVSLAFRAGHSVKVASNMSRFAHLIQVEDSGETLSKYACKVIVELMMSSISPRSSCESSMFLLRQTSKSVVPAFVQTGTFIEGAAPRRRLSEKDVELNKHIVTKQMDGDSFIMCFPVHENLVSETATGDAEIMGVVALQMPQASQKISDAEVDAIKVVCQHLAEALKNSSALIRTAKERANRQQYAAIDFLGNCIACADVNSMMISICKELYSFIHFDSVAAFTAKPRSSGSSSTLTVDQEWMISLFPDDSDRLSAQPGISRVLGQEVLTSSSSIGPLVVDGPESAGSMFGHYQLTSVVHSTKVNVRHLHGPKKKTQQPLYGCLFGVPLSLLQDDGSVHLCGSVVLIRDGHDSKSCCAELTSYHVNVLQIYLSTTMCS